MKTFDNKGTFNYLTLPARSEYESDGRESMGMRPFGWHLDMQIECEVADKAANFYQVVSFADGVFIAGLRLANGMIVNLSQDEVTMSKEWLYACRKLSEEWGEVDVYIRPGLLIFETEVYHEPIKDASSYYRGLFRRMGRWLQTKVDSDEMPGFDLEDSKKMLNVIPLSKSKDCLSLEELLAQMRVNPKWPFFPNKHHACKCEYCIYMMAKLLRLVFEERRGYKTRWLADNAFEGQSLARLGK